jgi:hypothetical protein
LDAVGRGHAVRQTAMRAVMTEIICRFLGVKVVTERNHHFRQAKRA